MNTNGLKSLNDSHQPILLHEYQELSISPYYRLERKTTSNPRRLPKKSRVLLLLLPNAGETEAVVGDVLERYTVTKERFGRTRANLYLYSEVCRSLYQFIGRLLFDTGLQLGRWIKKRIA